MGVKKLKHNYYQEVEIEMDFSSAILLIEELSGNIVYVYIDLNSNCDFSKLFKLKDIKNVKFIGSKKIFQELQKVELPWENFSKVFLLLRKTNVILINEKNTIRFIREDFEKVEEFKEEIESESIGFKKSVLIVDDSKVIQKILTNLINSSQAMTVMGVASSPSEASKILEHKKPDLITLDIHMPEMDGVEFYKTYIHKLNIPTVMISSVSMNEGPLVMDALSSGAITYMEKPSMEDIKEKSKEILDKLEVVFKSKNNYNFNSILQMGVTSKFNSTDGIILIGSSTGGPQALECVLRRLPKNIPPIVIVQHIPAVFSKALADRLNDLCSFKVIEAKDSTFLEPGTVYIAPGGHQTRLLKRGESIRIEVNDDPALNRFKPSVEYLFTSALSLTNTKKVAVMLTGMGKDGARAMCQLKKAGTFTIAQDEKTSVVFGMPKEVIKLGGATKVESIDNISQSIVTAFNALKK